MLVDNYAHEKDTKKKETKGRKYEFTLKKYYLKKEIDLIDSEFKFGEEKIGEITCLRRGCGHGGPDLWGEPHAYAQHV